MGFKMKTPITAVLAGVILVGTLPSYSSAEELSVCAHNKTGALRFAGKCKKAESLITLNTTGPTGPQGVIGPVGPQGIQGPKGEIGLPGKTGAAVKVFDSNNQYIGDLISSDEVYLPSLKAVFNFQFSQNWKEPFTTYFTASNCQGTDYYDPMTLAPSYLGPRLVQKDGKFHIAKAKTLETILVKSDGSKLDCLNEYNPPRSMSLSPGFDFVEVSPPFSLPLALPLRFE